MKERLKIGCKAPLPEEECVVLTSVKRVNLSSESQSEIKISVKEDNPASVGNKTTKVNECIYQLSDFGYTSTDASVFVCKYIL